MFKYAVRIRHEIARKKSNLWTKSGFGSNRIFLAQTINEVFTCRISSKANVNVHIIKTISGIEMARPLLVE